MKTLVLTLAGLSFVLVGLHASPSFAEEAEAAAKPQYIGVEGCSTCHKKDKTGNQLAIWQDSRHAKAYETLGGAKAKEIATAKGIADAQKAPECLQCHVTIHGVDPARIATPRKGKLGAVITDGVGCESCHGAGSDYKKSKVMKDHDASVAAGMVVPDEAVCLTCHNDKSPTVVAFDYKEASKKIAHPVPEPAAK